MSVFIFAKTIIPFTHLYILKMSIVMLLDLFTIVSFKVKIVCPIDFLITQVSSL